MQLRSDDLGTSRRDLSQSDAFPEADAFPQGLPLAWHGTSVTLVPYAGEVTDFAKKLRTKSQDFEKGRIMAKSQTSPKVVGVGVLP